MGDISFEEKTLSQLIPYGKEMLKHFLFDPNFKNMNHGSFGTYPITVRNKMREFQDQAEAQPDPFIRYTYPKLLNESRNAIANFLQVPTSNVVFVPNATTGVNTILRNIVWNQDGRDEILYFNTIYGACGKAIDYTCEASLDLVKATGIKVKYPIEDDALVDQFKATISASRIAGRRPRLAIFDTVSSIPGVRMPFEALTQTCHTENILSLIDGAHGIGQIPLDLTTLDPDFFVSNLHKWLHVPRACALFYIPTRNQHLIRSTLPTSHGFVPRDPAYIPFTTTLPPNTLQSEFVANFEFVGTLDNTPYICVPAALQWRDDVAGGDVSIRDYCRGLVRDGARRIAENLGTEVMDNAARTLTDCCMANVRLPLLLAHADQQVLQGEYHVRPGYGLEAMTWLNETMMQEYKTFMAIYFFQGAWWVRLSAQVYLDLADFEWAGGVLKELCQRIGREEYLAVKQKGPG